VASGDVTMVTGVVFDYYNVQRRDLHFLSSLVLASHSRDFSMTVQVVILDNLDWLSLAHFLFT